jgi:hypothetical protein
MKFRASLSSLVAAAVLAATSGPPTARAQTAPGAIPNPGTYQGSMQLQQEQDRQSQQFRQQSQQYQPQQQQQGYGPRTAPQSSNSRRPADCLDRLARRPIWRRLPRRCIGLTPTSILRHSSTSFFVYSVGATIALAVVGRQTQL